MHKGAVVGLGKVSGGTGNKTVDLDLTWGEQVYARNGLVSNSNLTLDGVTVDTLEAGAVGKDGLVGGTDGQFYSVKLGHN